MSKHLGNILEPIPLMDEHGADAVRWFMAAGGSPWAARRVGHTTIQETVRKVLLTYWNTVAFHVLYANLVRLDPGRRTRPRPPSGRCWTAGRCPRRTGWWARSPRRWSSFDTQRAGSLLSAYVDDLSNWYVRRSRRRFWDGDPAAFATLHECLRLVTQLMAPLAPFITERVWRDVFVATLGRPAGVGAPVQLAARDDRTGRRRPGRPDAAGPPAGRARPCRAGRGQGAAPGSRCAGRWSPRLRYDRLTEELRREVAEELNIGALEPLSAAGADLVDHSAKGNFRALGKRFAKDTPRVAAAIAAADAAALAADAQGGRGAASVDAGRRAGARCSPDEVIVSERPREGWSVVNEQGETVALDLELTAELRRAGLAREVVRMVQEARKNGGFEVSDRIALSWAVLDQEGNGEAARGDRRAPRADRRRGARLDDRRGRRARTDWSRPTPSSGWPSASTGSSSAAGPARPRRAGPPRAARRPGPAGRRPRRRRRAPAAAG